MANSDFRATLKLLRKAASSRAYEAARRSQAEQDREKADPNRLGYFQGFEAAWDDVVLLIDDVLGRE